MLKIRDFKEIDTISSCSAVIDPYTSLAPTLYLLSSNQFSIANFFEFCNLSEMIVLYDSLYTWPQSSPAESIAIPQPEFLEHNFMLLLEESVIKLTTSPQIPSQENYDKETLTKYWQCHERFRETQVGLHRAEYIEHLHNLSAFLIYGQNIHPSVYNATAYINALDIYKCNKIVNPLIHAYSIMSKAIASEINDLQNIRGIDSIVIPPIPSLILKKIDSPSQIIQELLILRNKFKKIRSAFKEYFNNIYGENIKLKDSLSALYELKKISNDLSLPYDKRGVSYISEWRDITDLLPKEFTDIDSQDFDPKSISKFLLGKPLSWIVQRIKRRKILPLFGMKRELYNLTDHVYLIKKIWKHDLTSIEIEEARNYLNIGDMALEGKKPSSRISPPLYASRDYLGINEPTTTIIKHFEVQKFKGNNRNQSLSDDIMVSKILSKIKNPDDPSSILEPIELFNLYKMRDKIDIDLSSKRAILHNILGGVGPGWYWLKDYSSEKVFDCLIDTLKHNNWEIRWATIYYLSKLRQVRAIPFLWPMLNDEAPKVKEYAVAGIANLYSRDDLQIFLPFLNDQDSLKRMIAVISLSRLGNKEEIPIMLNILNSGSRNEKLEIAKGISRLKDSKGKIELIKMKQEFTEDFGVAYSLSRYIPKMFNHSDIEYLLSLLHDENLRGIALEGLLLVTEIQDRYTIENALSSSPKGDIFSCLQIVLAKIQLLEGDPSFENIFTNKDPDVHKYAVKLIGLHGNEKHLILLKTALRSKYHYIRAEAAMSLKSIFGEKAIPLLEESAKNETQDATHSAKRALLYLLKSENFKNVWSILEKGIFSSIEEETIHFLADNIDFETYEWLQRFIDKDNWEGYFARGIITVADSKFFCPLDPYYKSPPWNEV